MKLQKFDITGTSQWTYTSPWDTATVWLGTLATDNAGNSYITAGTAPEIKKINTSGSQVWANTGFNQSCEYWSITFNCDKTKLIVGGTYVPNMFSMDFYAAIYDIDINSGNALGYVTVDMVNIGVYGVTPIEVRSITISKNAKYIFLTHKDVGAINQNISICPSDVPVFQLDNGHNLAYKCENYLPSGQNGGGLKAIVANDQFFYTSSGAQIFKRALSNGALLGTASIPGGSNQTDMFGDLYVKNSGLAVDNCGNVYAGSVNNVVKFDANLNLLSQTALGFTVYDVSVNSNGEVIAVGAQFDNTYASRNGQIQSVNMSACAQYSLVCCDANICNAGPFCTTDPALNLTSATAGGVWTGTGITNATNGMFNPSVADAGIHTIFYTLPCGTDSVLITVNSVDNYTISSIGATATVTNLTGANYQWIDCDNGNSIIAGKTDTSYTATVNGNYGVIINQNGCTSISTCVFIDVTNIEQNKNNYGIKIFPNPTNGILNIKFENEANNVNIEIENIIGQEIYKTNSNQVKGNMLSIDLGKYKNGFYIIKINNDNLNLKYKVLYEKNATN